MTDALAGSGRLWVPVGIGVLAGALAVSPAWAASAALAITILLAFTWWCLLDPPRWVLAFLCAALLLPPLPFALGNSGPHPALAAAAIGLWIAILRLREWRIPATPATGALLFFFAVLLASVALAALYSGPAIAAASFARVLLFGISVCVFLYTAGTDAGEPWHEVRILFAAAVIAAAFACIDFYFQFPAPAGYGPQFVWTDTGVYRRAQGLFYEASTLGNFCAFFLIMIAVAWLRPAAERPVGRAWLLTGAAVLGCALVLSYSRASIVNLAVAMMVLLFVRRVRLRRAAVAGAASLAGAAAVVWAAFPAFARLYWDRLWASAYYFISLPEPVLSGRVASWRQLTAFLAERPWHLVFGVGYKTLPYSSVTGQPVVADNMYLSILVETGLAGLIALLLLNFAILHAAWRAARQPAARPSFFGAWILCFWSGQMFQMLSGDLLTYWRVLPVYFWVLAMAVRGTLADTLR